MGFGTFYDMFGMGLEEKAWGAADGEVFDFVRDKLKDQKRPFCYYIISMSSHEPFTLMESYFTTTAYDDVKDELLKRFLTAMTYTDGELGRFVNYLRKNLTNTYIIIYGDHTPAIPKNVYNKASFTDDARLFEFVPCYVITPEGIVARETVQAASFLDIAPTVLHAAKVGCTYKSNGIDLLARIKDPFNIEYIGKTYPRSRLFSMMKTNR
jgi:phosphoglycerol transferase MdoB-like AlkP superfamily enzyme